MTREKMTLKDVLALALVFVTAPLWGPIWLIEIIWERVGPTKPRRHVGCLTYHPIMDQLKINESETK